MNINGLIKWAVVAAMLLAANTSTAQSIEDEKAVPVIELRTQLKNILPYHDTVNHLTVSSVSVDLDYRLMRFVIKLDEGQVINDANWYLHYMVKHELWNLAPLGESSFELRLMVQTPAMERKGTGGGSYTFKPAEILQALQPPLWQQAREYIGAYARHVASTLPHTVAEGETMVGCRYDAEARVMTTTFEYADGYWPAVKEYVSDNMGAVRKDRARALVADTATSLAFVAYKGDVTLRYVFRSHQGGDSIEMLIPSWMWESVFEPGTGSKSDTLKMVQYIANEVNRQCPTIIDSATTPVSCSLDTIARLMVYTYRVDESTMHGLKNNPAALQSLEQSVERAFHSTAGRAMGKYVVAAGVRVEYRYGTAASAQPITVVMSPSRIREILEKR